MKLRNVWAVIGLILMTAVVTGCSLKDSFEESDPKTDPVDIDSIGPKKAEPFVLTPAEQEMVNHSNEFAFNLFRQIVDSRSADESKKNESIIISPISITYALGMLNNGAAGNTQAQINKVLGFDDTGAAGINDFCKKMLDSIPHLDALTKVMIANNIYVNKNYVLKPEFTQTANTYYNAYPETRDFYDGKTMDVINKWASDHTEKMIDKVLDEGSFNPDAVSYLLNAIYFKGMWTSKFNKEQTYQEEFYHAGNSQDVTTSYMMNQIGQFNYTDIDGYQVLCLPYGNQAFNMTIFLPRVTEWETVHALPTVPSVETWQQLKTGMHGKLVNVKLPRIETDTDVNLNEIMSALGMPDAFDSDKADFSDFCNTDVYIGLMKQVAKIKLDEEGTEAAAVTVVGTLETAMHGYQPTEISFNANHPFLYVISENSTGAILFIGQYTGY